MSNESEPIKGELVEVKAAESKPGIKTTEFWVSLGTGLVGAAAAGGFITPEQANATTQAIIQAAGLLAMVASAFGYNLSRGKAKGGDK